MHICIHIHNVCKFTHEPSYVRLFMTPSTIACQEPLSLKFSRQKYWNGLPFWCWERLKVGGKGDNRGPSPTQWTWVWANSGRWWRTGKPGVLQSMRLQRVRCYWATEQQLQEYVNICTSKYRWVYMLIFIWWVCVCV